MNYRDPYFLGTRVDSAYIQLHRGAVSYTRDDLMTILLAHELIHGLGLDHVGPQFDSIMSAAEFYDTPLKSLLYPLDREALRVLYGQMSIGQPFESLGPWSSMSIHLQGVSGHVEYGVALRNDYVEPWARGHMPGTDLADSNLTGSATWTGALLGFTPDARPVVGSARIGVSLNTLTGYADFTALEQWATGTAPGEPGTGAMWGDGDLGYPIAVSGNTFRETGGDVGTLTGIFTGESHMGAAGTLERQDLTAAFGASR